MTIKDYSIHTTTDVDGVKYIAIRYDPPPPLMRRNISIPTDIYLQLHDSMFPPKNDLQPGYSSQPFECVVNRHGDVVRSPIIAPHVAFTIHHTDSQPQPSNINKSI